MYNLLPKWKRYAHKAQVYDIGCTHIDMTRLGPWGLACMDSIPNPESAREVVRTLNAVSFLMFWSEEAT